MTRPVCVYSPTHSVSFRKDEVAKNGTFFPTSSWKQDTAYIPHNPHPKTKVGSGPVLTMVIYTQNKKNPDYKRTY